MAGNIVVTILFTIEAVFKLIGLGVRQYFRRNWNRFDFFIVIVSWIGKKNTLKLN